MHTISIARIIPSEVRLQSGTSLLKQTHAHMSAVVVLKYELPVGRAVDGILR